MNSITDLLGMGDMEVVNFEQDTDSIFLQVEKKREVQVCPACGALTDRIHDYRTQRVRDLSI